MVTCISLPNGTLFFDTNTGESESFVQVFPSVLEKISPLLSVIKRRLVENEVDARMPPYSLDDKVSG